MSELPIQLSKFAKGYLLAWTILAKCDKTIMIKLSAGEKTYFSESIDTIPEKTVKQGMVSIDTDLELLLTVYADDYVSSRHSIYLEPILCRDACIIGNVYDIFIDFPSADKKNEVCINFAGWAAEEVQRRPEE